MKSDINVTPLIDVLLVLLIIFMIVAPAPPRALDASLPQARRGRGAGTHDDVVLEIQADGFAVNRTPVWTLAELESRLREALDTRHHRAVFVRASAEVAYHRVMDALDAARGAGADRIGMLDPEPKGAVIGGGGAD